MSRDRKVSQSQFWNHVRPCYIGGVSTAVVASFMCGFMSPGVAKSIFGFIAIVCLGAALGVLFLASKIDRECFEAIEESEYRS